MLKFKSIKFTVLFSIAIISNLYASSGNINLDDSENSNVVNLNQPSAAAFKNKEIKKINAKNIMTSSDGWVRIGLFVPLSGKASNIGISLKQAAQIALFSTNNNKIILQYYDTNDVSLNIKDLTKKAISENVNIILGPLFGTEVHDISKIANSYGIPVISFSNDEKSLNSTNVYSINYLLSQEIDQIIGFSSAHGRKTISAIIPEDSNENIIIEAIKNSSDKYSSKIKNIVKYEKGNQTSIAEAVKIISDYQRRNNIANKIKSFLREKIKKCSIEDLSESSEDSENTYCDNIKKLEKTFSSIKAVGQVDIDSIFVYGDTNDLISIGSYLLYYDIGNKSSVKIIGTSILDNKTIFAENGYSGAWFTGKNNIYSKSFESEYATIFNTKPSKLSMLSYDAVSVVSTISKNGYFDSEKLNNASGFMGISGLFRFRENGRVNRAFEIKEVLPRTSRTILKSSKSFSEAAQISQNNINKSKSLSDIKTLKRTDLNWILDNIQSLNIDEINNFLIEE